MRTRFDLKVRGVLIVLLVTAGLFGPADAEAQNFTRLEMVKNSGGKLYHRGSDDGGATWSYLTWLPWELKNEHNQFIKSLRIVGPPSVITDRPGRLRFVARATDGYLIIADYHVREGRFFGWERVPGDTFAGGIRIGGRRYYWNADSYPAYVNRGDNKFDVFMHATRDDGAIALVHFWFTGYWIGDLYNWEVLGTGLMQGSPAAVSWGPGRLDLFARGGDNTLIHKWFDNGRWSGWEGLGGYITSSPAATSSEPFHVDVYAASGDRAVYHKVFHHAWFDWERLGGLMGPDVPLAVTSNGPGNIALFEYGDDALLYQWSWNYGWTRRLRDASLSGVAAVHWNP